MNYESCFKIIWNTVNQCWIAVSELSKSVGKSSQIDKRKALNVIILSCSFSGCKQPQVLKPMWYQNDLGKYRWWYWCERSWWNWYNRKFCCFR
ncbi:hypothetical protein INP90_07590 [Haemophilus parainfluenzae]|nr:hypothetical protein INP90_07590 [Haemophilus parainfluenzae]